MYKKYFVTIIVVLSISLFSAGTSSAFEDSQNRGVLFNTSFYTSFYTSFSDVIKPDFSFKYNVLNAVQNEFANEGPDYGKWHKYLGFTTIALAGAAAISSSQKSIHYGTAYAATGTAFMTCYTGYAEYAERFDMEEGLLAGDNLHILTGVIGTVLMTTAVGIADSGKESGHAGIGSAGGGLMLISVIVINW